MSDTQNSGGGTSGQTVTFIYTTLPSMDQANRLADALVGEGLAACANAFGGMTSTYVWDGKVQREQEVAVIFKTQAARAAAAIAEIERLHPYDVPVAVAFDAAHAAGPFAKWIADQTSSAV